MAGYPEIKKFRWQIRFVPSTFHAACDGEITGGVTNRKPHFPTPAGVRLLYYPPNTSRAKKVAFGLVTSYTRHMSVAQTSYNTTQCRYGYEARCDTSAGPSDLLYPTHSFGGISI